MDDTFLIPIKTIHDKKLKLKYLGSFWLDDCTPDWSDEPETCFDLLTYDKDDNVIDTDTYFLSEFETTYGYERFQAFHGVQFQTYDSGILIKSDDCGNIKVWRF